jgi:uncharacterized membrane-anchored protein
VQPTAAKPVVQSKTLWSAAFVMLLAVLQTWLSASVKVAGLCVLLLMAAGLALIMFERLKKLKEEGL